MTALTSARNKRVRVENADPSPTPLKVTPQIRTHDGTWVDEPHFQSLSLPTSQGEFYLSGERRLIVEVA